MILSDVTIVIFILPHIYIFHPLIKSLYHIDHQCKILGQLYFYQNMLILMNLNKVLIVTA